MPRSNAATDSRRQALWLSTAFAALGGGWIFVSDWLLNALIADPATVANLQTFKGLSFVAVSAFLLYLVLRLWSVDASVKGAPFAAEDEGPDRLYKLVWGISFLVIASLLVNFSYNAWSGRKAIEDAAEEESRNLVRIIAEQTTASINAADVALQFFATAVGSIPDAGDAQAIFNAQMRARLGLLPFLGSIIVLDAAGKVRHATDPGPGIGTDLSSRDYFRHHRDDPSPELYVSPPLVIPRTGRQAFIVSRRLSSSTGAFAGTVSGAIDIPYLQRVFDSLETRHERSISLARQDGIVLVRSPMVEGIVGRSFASLPLYREYLPKADAGTYRAQGAGDGVTRIFSYRALSGRPLVVVLGLSEADILAPWRRQNLVYFGIVMAAMFTVVWLSYLIGAELRRRGVLTRSLRESEARFRAFMAASPALAWIKDEEGRYVDTNPAWQKAFGYLDREWRGRTEFSGVPAAAAQSIRESDLNVLRSGLPSKEMFEFAIDGRNKYWNIVKFPIIDAAGHKYIAGIATDVTEQKQGEAALTRSLQRQRELGARLIEVEESERRAINRELHDRLGQGLATLKLLLDMVQASLSSEAQAAASDRLRNATRVLDGCIADVRDIMGNLHPPALVDYGLRSALATYVESMGKGTQTSVSLEGDDIEPRLPPAIELAMFRIVQGALTNALKHARSAHVDILIETTADHVTLTVSDDGAGFDMAQVEQSNAGWGLAIMRERAETAGMVLRIESAPGNGTRVTVQVLRAAA